jgi:hypothetical protein
MSDKVSTLSYSASSFLTVLAAINIEYIMMGLGLFIAVLTFLMNWYFKHREDKRASQLQLLKYKSHQAELQRADEIHISNMAKQKQLPPHQNLHNIRPKANEHHD